MLSYTVKNAFGIFIVVNTNCPLAFVPGYLIFMEERAWQKSITISSHQ